MPRKTAFKCYFGCIPYKGKVHRFPPQQYPHTEKFNQWKMVLSEIDRERPDNYICNNIRICDHHFEEVYRTPTGYLTKTAVPTLNIGIPMHRFPSYEKFPARFKAWVKCCGGKLESASDYECYKKKLICDRHFTDQDHNRNQRLNALAVPSLYLSGITLHSFPNPSRLPEQFQLWVDLVSELVQGLTPAQIYSRKKVCDLHFTPDDRNRNNRLNAIAIPVPFPYQKDSHSVLHGFPNPDKYRDRFRSWVYAVGGEIVGLEDLYIYKHRRVCHAHFEEKYRTRYSRISTIAVPTINITGPLAIPPLNIVDRRRPLSVKCLKQNVSCSKGPKVRKRASSTTSETHLEPDHASNDIFDTEHVSTLEQPERLSKDHKPYTYDSIVPAAKIYSWQKTGEVLPDQLDDAPDDMLMYCDDNDSTLDDHPHKEDSTEHEGFRCDVCHGSITGFRYTCVQCSDFDLCGACENNNKHQQHYVLRVPAPRPVAEVQFVLATIRRYLKKRLDPKRKTDQERDDISVKSEVQSDNEDDEDKQKANSGHESDSSDASAAARVQSDHEDADCSIISDVEHSQASESIEQRAASTDEIPTGTDTTKNNNSKMVMKRREDPQESESESESLVELNVLRTSSRSYSEQLRKNRRKTLMVTRADAQESENKALEEQPPVQCIDLTHCNAMQARIAVKTTNIYSQKGELSVDDHIVTDAQSTLPAPPATAKRKISVKDMSDLINIDKSTPAKKIHIQPIPNTTLRSTTPRLLPQNTGFNNPYVKLRITRLPPGAIVMPVSKVTSGPSSDAATKLNETHR